MSYSNDDLNDIYDKTDGYCLYCETRLAFTNHGIRGARAAWEVDHYQPVSRGGDNDFGNLWPACVDCNVLKSDMTGDEFIEWRQELEDDFWGELFKVGAMAVGIGLVASWLSNGNRFR